MDGFGGNGNFTSTMCFRLTPTLMFFILFSAKLRPFFGAGPLWFLQLIDSSTCSETWWKHMLYVNDFTPEDPTKVRPL